MKDIRKIIGINGEIGSGKSTLCLFITNYLKKYNVQYKQLNFADKLKEICEILTGFKGITQEEKNIYITDYDKTVGQILQIIGTDAMRDHFDKNVWIKACFRELDPFKFNIISDVRFLNEAKAIKEKGGLLIRLEGDPANVRQNSTRNINHASEIELRDYDGFDAVFTNDQSLDDLKTFAENIIDNYFDSVLTKLSSSYFFEKHFDKR